MNKKNIRTSEIYLGILTKFMRINNAGLIILKELGAVLFYHTKWGTFKDCFLSFSHHYIFQKINSKASFFKCFFFLPCPVCLVLALDSNVIVLVNHSLFTDFNEM